MKKQTCPRCEISKSATTEFFYRLSGTINTLESWCILCKSEYYKTPTHRAYQKKYRKKNRKKMKAYQAQYYLAHRGKHIERDG